MVHVIEWISGDRSAIAQWDYGVIGGSDSSSSPSSPSSDSSAAPTSSAPAQRRDAAAEVDDTVLAERQESGTRSYRTYGTRSDFAIIDYATHYSHPFVPKTSNYINPIPQPTATRQAPLLPVYPSPVATVAGGIAYHKVYRQTQLAFSEVGDQTEYGYWYACKRTYV